MQGKVTATSIWIHLKKGDEDKNQDKGVYTLSRLLYKVWSEVQPNY